MRILQVMAGAQHGGAETAFVDMCLALHEAGEEIAVVTRGSDIRAKRLHDAGIPVHFLPFGGRLDVFTPWRLSKIIRDLKPHIVQTWMRRAALKTPRWRESMNIPRYLLVARLGGYYALKYFKASEYFTTITPDIRNFLIKGGIEPDHVRHINNFAETEDAPTPIDRATMRTPENATVILALGRLHQSKAFDTLTRAAAALPGIHVWIAGEGPDRAALEKLIIETGTQDRIKLLGWREDRAALFQASDICVFPSRYEPFGTVFVQAWAQRKPLIASEADGPRQFVRNGQDGLLFPIDDVEALRAAIARLAGDAELKRTLSENGYARYTAEFTKAGTVSQYLAFYREIRAREGL